MIAQIKFVATLPTPLTLQMAPYCQTQEKGKRNGKKIIATYSMADCSPTSKCIHLSAPHLAQAVYYFSMTESARL